MKRAAESTTRSETKSEEELDGEPDGVAGGGEESQGERGSSGSGRRMDEQSPRLLMGQEHGGEGQSSKHLNIEGQSIMIL